MITSSDFDSLDPLEDASKQPVREEKVHDNWNKALKSNAVKVKSRGLKTKKNFRRSKEISVSRSEESKVSFEEEEKVSVQNTS